MDEKAQGISEALASVFDGSKIEYQFANELHQFRINGKPTHWLYLAREFVDDHTEQEIVSRLEQHKIFDELKSSKQSRWLFVGENGAKEVDDAFGKGGAL